MNDYRKPHQNHDIARFVAGSCIIAVLLIIAFLAVKSAYGMYHTFSVAAAEAEGARVELDALRAQEAHVKATLAALGTERGVEEAVRERFGVARPGEGEIRIVRDEGKEGEGESTGEGNIFTRFIQSLFVW